MLRRPSSQLRVTQFIYAKQISKTISKRITHSFQRQKNFYFLPSNDFISDAGLDRSSELYSGESKEAA